MTKKVNLISRSHLTTKTGVLLDSNIISLADVEFLNNLVLKIDSKNLLIFTLKSKKNINNILRNMLSPHTKHPILSLIEFFESILFYKNPLVEFSREKLNIWEFRSKEAFSKVELGLQIVEIDSIDEISEHSLDILIYQGFIYSPQVIADRNSCPVLSFSGDSMAHEGLLELANRLSQTSFCVAKFIPFNIEPQILLSGSYLTQRFYILNKLNLRMRRTIGLVKALDFMNDISQVEVQIPEERIGNQIEGSPQVNILKYCRHVVGFVVSKIWNKYVARKRYSWEIRFSSEKGIPAYKSSTSDAPEMSSSHFADPFLFENIGAYFLFAEEYPAWGGNGCISVFEVAGQELNYLGSAIKESYHLSFPFIFRSGSEIYICPESSKNKSLQIYRSTNFPMGWDEPITLIDEVDAADPIILQGENGLWYMLCTVDRFNFGDHSSELFAFYADSLDAEVWKPHALNPIVISPGEARNGGLVQLDGRLIRIAQSYGFLKYGEGYSHREIRMLSETEFDEIELGKVGITDLGLSQDAIGTHHFSSLNNFAATDILFYN